MKNDQRMSFIEHLIELRVRFLNSALFLAFGFAIAYFFSKPLFRYLRIPFDEAYQNVYGQIPKLQNITMLEGFLVYLRVGFLGGIFIASPFIFHQMWKFIFPALNGEEKKYVIPVLGFASLFFIGGAVFGYWVVFPKSFEFLLSITKGELVAQNIRMQDYFKFASMMLLGFGVAFEFPLVVLILIATRLITPKQLASSWRMVIVLILALSAILTPADIASMLLMAIPLLLLYLLTIAAAFLLFGRRKESAQ